MSEHATDGEMAAIARREMEQLMQERRVRVPKPAHPIRMVVCAANRLREHPLCIAIGPRHFSPLMHDQIRAFIQTGGGHTKLAWTTSEQGFIDQWGQFMTREEAWVVAVAAGQVRYGPHLAGGRLDSSDLY